MLVDVTGLRKRFRDYPNIVRFLDLLIARGSYGMLDRIARTTNADVIAMGMTLQDLDDLACSLLPSHMQK